MTFESNTKKWKTSPVLATSDNIAEAKKWVSNLSTTGGTDVTKALKEAFSDSSDKMRTAYLLCDGDINISDIPTFITGLNSNRNPDVKIHTISFANGVSDKL